MGISAAVKGIMTAMSKGGAGTNGINDSRSEKTENSKISKSLSTEGESDQTQPAWLKPKDHDYTVGRDGSVVPSGKTSPSGLGAFIDKYLPAGHVFGANHDGFVGFIQQALRLPSIIENVFINYPSMVVMYPAAIVQELINTPTGLYNSAFGTEHNVPLPHNPSQ